MSVTVTLKQLFESKAGLGHATRYWHPKMGDYIFGKRNGMHLIDLDKTKTALEKALDFLRELGSRRGSKVLFVGTKRVAQTAIKEQASRAGMPYVDQYWRGGNLTNYSVNSHSTKVLKDMEATHQQESFGEGMTKKERGNFERELARLQKEVGGIKDMIGLPDALFVVDVGEEKNAVSEAKKLGIPVIGIVDTNHSPDGIAYVIPGNDDATASVELYTRLAADAILEGRKSIVDTAPQDTSPQPIIKRVKKATAHQESPLAKAATAPIATEKSELIDENQPSNELGEKTTNE